MMKTKLLKSLFLGLLLFSTSCVKDNLYDDKVAEKQIQDFNFSTRQTPLLNVDYKVDYPVLFHVYDQDPYIQGTRTVKEGVKPVFSAYTDEKGKYSSEIIIPAIVNKVYVVSGAICVQNIMTSEVVANTITAIATDNLIETKSGAAALSRAYSSSVYKTLGTWDSNGTMNYFLANSITLSSSTLSALNTVFTDAYPVNKKYFQSNDLIVKEDATVNLYFVDENAGYYNTLFYYCYDTNTEQNLTKAEIIKRLVVVFPNVKKRSSFGPLRTGAGVALHYFEGGVDRGVRFPAGKSIGWVLGSNGYKGQGAISVSEYFFSNPRLNPELTGEKNHVAVFLKDNLVILGFEDTQNNAGDGDCNDAVFTVTATPMKAITDGIPDANGNRDPKAVAYTNELNGTLAFEDNWPTKGDYDMNDVMVKYHSLVSYNYLNQILFTDDEYTVLWSGANYRSGFGYELNTPRNNATIEVLRADYKSSFVTLSPTAPKATILLTDDARAASGENTKAPVYRVRTTFKTPISTNSAKPTPFYNPFILIQNKVELHLPDFAPSGVFNNASLFGTLDDKSIPSQGIYYRSTGYYPFAIDVVGTDPLILNDKKFEGNTHSISLTYPDFISWVTSKGANNKDWYKRPKR